MQKSDSQSSWYVSFIKRLLFVLFIFMICRVLFYFFNQSFFSVSFQDLPMILWGGIKFDIAGSFYINSLFIALSILPFQFKYNALYQKLIKWVYVVSNSLAVLTNTIDTIYYRYTLKRTTWSVFSEFSNEDNLSTIGISFITNYWYLILIWIVITLSFIIFYNKTTPKIFDKDKNLKFYMTHALGFIISVPLFIGGIRGDLKKTTRPIAMSNAGAYVKNPKDMYLVINTPFSIIRSYGFRGYKKVSTFNDTTLKGIYNPYFYPDNAEHFTPKNVVIIIVESLGKESIGFYNQQLENNTYKGFTPFIDSLSSASYVYKYAYANGTKSIEGLPSVLASIPSIKEPFVLSSYVANYFPTLPKILKTKGYQTAFFHGAPNGSMGFTSFTNILGIENYYGKTEYNNETDFDGCWGIWDEPFLQYFGKTMTGFKEPFCSTIFTLSSHDPYKIPEKYNHKFKEGPLPIFKSIGYTDYALKQFFNYAKQQSWYQNTLFVITADHAATWAHHKEYQTNAGSFEVPIMFFDPSNQNLKGFNDSILAQQIDILPTVLDYLNYEKTFFTFGKSLLKPDKNFVVNYRGGYQLFYDNWLLLFDGEKSTALYQFKTDKMLEKNLVNEQKEQKKKLETFIKAYIQQYNNRMIENKMR